jgi:hypothetical protein
LLAFSKLIFAKHRKKYYYSQFGEDCVITQWVGKHNNAGFFVDVGCYHPVKHSNTFELYKRGWRGINVDLEASKILSFKIRRPGDVNVLSAVSDKAGQVDVFAPKRFSVLTTIDKQKATECNFQKIGVIPCDTLTNIIDNTKFKGHRIDLLSIDVEGVDLNVLMSLDFERYSPRLIVIESSDKDVQAVINSDINRFLVSKGYVLKNWVGPSLIYGASFS